MADRSAVTLVCIAVAAGSSALDGGTGVAIGTGEPSANGLDRAMGEAPGDAAIRGGTAPGVSCASATEVMIAAEAGSTVALASGLGEPLALTGVKSLGALTDPNGMHAAPDDSARQAIAGK